MGRKGRPVKVKVAPRKPSLSVSSKEGDGGDSSSSSLVRAIASCLQPTPVVRPQISPMVSDNRVGLSWVSILKGGGSGSGALNGGGDGSPGASSPLKQGESSAHSAGGMEALNVPVGSSDVARSKPDESVGALGNRTVPLLSSQAEQLPLATANGFAVLATENEVPMEKVLPNTAPGADSIPSNG
ncbi:unnamed protein product [Amaranthus hypochondriacus]